MTPRQEQSPFAEPTRSVAGVHGDVHAHCLDLVIRSISSGPAMATAIDVVADRARDERSRIRFYWRRK